MRSSSFGGRTLRRVAVLASAAVTAVMMVPTAAPVGAAGPEPVSTGPGDCAGVVAWDAIPLLGPATPTGGSVGTITKGGATFVDTGVPDPLIAVIAPGATLNVAQSVQGIAVYPTALLDGSPIAGAKDSSLKFSVSSSPSVPTHYLGQARWASPNGFGGPKIDVGPMHIGLTPLGLPVAINDVLQVPGGGRGALGVSTASAAPAGTVTATYFVWQNSTGLPSSAACTLGYLMCVVVPFNGLPVPPGCPV